MQVDALNRCLPAPRNDKVYAAPINAINWTRCNRLYVALVQNQLKPTLTLGSKLKERFNWFFTPNNKSSKVIAITIGTIISGELVIGATQR